MIKNSFLEMPEYKQYVDSGIDRIGKIPMGWSVKKLKFCAEINSRTLPENTSAKRTINYVDIGSVSLVNGIEKSETFTFSESPSRARRLAKAGDTIVSTVRTYLKAISFIEEEHKDYVFSTGFAVLSPRLELNSKYFARFIKSNAFTQQVDDIAKGMSYPAINSSELSNMYVVIAPESSQVAIANFLDKKTAQIDEAVAIKQQQIELLKERKQIIIQQAVTQGLAPNVPMKDSGVDWIGRIPKHWEVKRAKYLFDEIDERSVNGDEELLSVSHITGVTPRSEKNVTMIAEDYSGSKTCKKNDLVMNIMWAWMGALGVSERPGIVSSAYSIFRQKPLNIFNPVYLEWLLKTVGYIEHYNKVSTGLHSSRLRFYSRMFFDMEIGFPCRNEQDQIVAHVEVQSNKIDQAVKLQLQQIEKLKEYKTILINSAVTGKIKVPQKQESILN
ncbi:restriction endonuclease subunit S [Aliivibrio finisterrensis]|uniref:Restriction endonuclease subunit S n=1 Tax=Aliivibrio finisterrensis TaxID=511998 RepID=A0ABY0I8H3_9GAMM|nr:restriction endonuclease subunit S [Aliivibrio finisterrensis]RYU65618.1 restriction endonuclease subunit S [Aliivibrio finisterrensis]RYU86260.1 restriction endonuclease subunit S [Aliivibrio finisterrensis]